MYKVVQMLPALGWGGAQIFCIQLCNELAKYPGYEVTLVSMYHHKPNEHLPLEFLDKRIKFVTLGKKKGLDARMFFRINKLIKQIKPDVVHTHLHSGYYCFLAYLTTYRQNLFRRIHTFHSLVDKDAPWHGRLAYKYMFNRNIIHPVSISEEVLKSAIREYGKHVTTIINNGALPASPSPAFAEITEKINTLKKNPATKVLLHMARISKEKNQHLIIDSMSTLEKEDANVIAVILGDYLPADKELYDGLISKKASNTHFMGRVKNVGDYCLNADAFLLSSTYEGLPISLLEGLSAGLVPVCTPVGGIRNLVKKDIGFLSGEVGYESYLAALKQYLNTRDDKLEQMKKNGKDLYEGEFSIAICAKRYDKLYHS